MLLDGRFRSTRWSLGEEPEQGDTYGASSKRTHTHVQSSYKKEIIESTPVKTMQQACSLEYSGHYMYLLHTYLEPKIFIFFSNITEYIIFIDPTKKNYDT
jgi:hypothetical protein